LDFPTILEAVKSQKGPIVLQRLSLKIGKDINKLAAERVADAALAQKALAAARELGVAI
jgi:hypothetical protein